MEPCHYIELESNQKHQSLNRDVSLGQGLTDLEKQFHCEMKHQAKTS